MNQIPITKFFESNDLEKEAPIDVQINEWAKSYNDKPVKPLFLTQPEIKKVPVYFRELKKTIIFYICTIQYLELSDSAAQQLYMNKNQ